MAFYEEELRKIVSPYYPDATYVGRTCYVRLDEMNRAKINFAATCVLSDHDALRMTVLNRDGGKVDSVLVRFDDLLGTKHVDSPYYPNGVVPSIMYVGDMAEWRAYIPNQSDYEKLGEAVSAYLSVYQEQTQESSPGWGQTM
jgi:hypothetical protein